MTLVEEVRARAFTVPTDSPESDGTLAWDATTMIVVTVRAGGRTGLGYGYGPAAVARLIGDQLAGVVRGRRSAAAARRLGRHAGRAAQRRPGGRRRDGAERGRHRTARSAGAAARACR